MSKKVDILFIQPPHQRRPGSGVTAPLGLAYLASYVRKKGFVPRILDSTVFFDNVDGPSIQRLKEWITNQIKEKPQLAFGIGPCMTPTIRGTIAIADLCHEIYPEIPLIFGGPLASTRGQEWFFFERLHASAIIPGDGEIALAKYLYALQQKDVTETCEGVMTDPSQKVRPNVIEDLDQLPFPARDLFPHQSYYLSVRRDIFAYPFATVITSRGCPNICPFCVTGALSGGRQRNRSLVNIAAEIEHLSKQYNVKSIVFYDDQLFPYFSSVNEDILSFCSMMKKSSNGALWQVEMRTDVALELDDDIIKKMFQTGCRQLNFGIEKGTEKGMRVFRKNCSPEEVREICSRIAKISPKMRLTGTFILGGPNETEDDLIETIKFSTSLNLLFAHYNPLQLYPGTKFYQDRYGIASHYWLEAALKDGNLSCELIYESPELPKERILNHINNGYKTFYERSEWRRLASRLLGERSNEIFDTVFSWQNNRFKGY